MSQTEFPISFAERAKRIRDKRIATFRRSGPAWLQRADDGSGLTWIEGWVKALEVPETINILQSYASHYSDVDDTLCRACAELCVVFAVDGVNGATALARFIRVVAERGSDTFKLGKRTGLTRDEVEIGVGIEIDRLISDAGRLPH